MPIAESSSAAMTLDGNFGAFTTSSNVEYVLEALEIRVKLLWNLA
jgi:hypothetical protein